MDLLSIQDTAEDLDGASSSRPTRKTPANGEEASRSKPQPSRLRAFTRFDSDTSPASPSSESPAVNGSANERDQDHALEAQGQPMWMQMKAGPSDYWRRSPSPPTPVAPPATWRELSTEPWPEDLEDGPSDYWSAFQSAGRVFQSAGREDHRPEALNGHGRDMPFQQFGQESRGNDHRQFEDSVEEIEEELGILPGGMRGPDLPMNGLKPLVMEEERASLTSSMDDRNGERSRDRLEELGKTRDNVVDDGASSTFELPQQVSLDLQFM